MRASARGGCQTLGLRAGRPCFLRGRPFSWDAQAYPSPHTAWKTQGPFPVTPDLEDAVARMSERPYDCILARAEIDKWHVRGHAWQKARPSHELRQTE